MSELKRCPICGGEAEIKRKGSSSQSMIIGCTDCGCRVESGDVHGLTKPESYKWNMRTRDADNAQLREALGEVKKWAGFYDDCECADEFYRIADKALKGGKQ